MIKNIRRKACLAPVRKYHTVGSPRTRHAGIHDAHPSYICSFVRDVDSLADEVARRSGQLEVGENTSSCLLRCAARPPRLATLRDNTRSLLVVPCQVWSSYDLLRPLVGLPILPQSRSSLVESCLPETMVGGGSVVASVLDVVVLAGSIAAAMAGLVRSQAGRSRTPLAAA